jgi:hypothetical protein
MTTGSYQQNRLALHANASAKPALLGILMSRSASDSATGKGARGISWNMGKWCIKVHAGRAINPAALVASSSASRW